MVNVTSKFFGFVSSQGISKIRATQIKSMDTSVLKQLIINKLLHFPKLSKLAWFRGWGKMVRFWNRKAKELRANIRFFCGSPSKFCKEVLEITSNYQSLYNHYNCLCSDSHDYHCTNKFSIKDFFSKCEQVRRKLRIWSHLLNKASTLSKRKNITL